jgi:hypothetical protein
MIIERAVLTRIVSLTALIVAACVSQKEVAA